MVTCPIEVGPFIQIIIETSLSSVIYDPNYHDEDANGMDIDEDQEMGSEIDHEDVWHIL